MKIIREKYGIINFFKLLIVYFNNNIYIIIYNKNKII
jgi:hypothetical protein